MQQPRAIRVGLLWHSVRSGNLGVGALTVSNIVLLREACAEFGLKPTFIIMGGREAGPAYVTGDDIESVDVDRDFLLSRSRYWALLGTLDCIVDIGGGDSFSDIYGLKGLGLMSLPKLLALAHGRPLLLSPQTIGPFERFASRRVAAYIMNRSAVLARDPTSLDYADKLAPRARTSLSADVAFKLPYDQAPPATDGRLRIGVNVSGLLFSKHGPSSFGLDVDYAALMRSLLARLSERQDLRVQLLTHVVSDHLDYDDDARVADQLAVEFPAVERVPDFGHPSRAKSMISGLDLLIAGRMHACIAAFSSGVPVIPVAYSRKFSGLFEGILHYPHGVPVKGWSTEQALDYLLAAIDRRNELKRDVAAGLARVEEKLDVYRAELRRFLAEAIAE